MITIFNTWIDPHQHAPERRNILLAGLLVCLLSPSLLLAQSDGSFSDQTVASGIDAQFGGDGMHSFLAGGAVGDFNGDGWQDVFIPTGGNGPDQLWINNQNGSFSEQAATWGVALEHRSSAAAAADYDNDGRLDLFVTSLGPDSNSATGAHRLYRNTGTAFNDVASSAGVAFSSTGSADGWGAAWGDYDLDGWLDLAIAGWNDTATGNRLYRNNGDGTFSDVTSSAGLANLSGTNGFAPRFVDMDGDRYPELIWIGDFSTGHYYINNGDGTFSDGTAASNTNTDGTEMGMAVADWDEDGDFDFYVTTINTNNLYINQGNHTYSNQASSAGVVNTGWGWATTAVDFNNDSLVDIVATAQNDRHYAFINRGLGAGLDFDEIGTSNGVGISVNGRGLSHFDYDNDGDQDLISFPRSGSVRLLRNDLNVAGRNWLRIFLDRGSAIDIPAHGIGSVIELTIGARTLLGRIDGGSNYLSQNELSAHFGLDTATQIDQLLVRWTNGETTTLENVTVNQTITVAANGELILRDGFE
ncbi:MAG: CRTAC1 family protein [Wenzhouxiangellaceae bacterium]